jgi:uncharacterized protein
MKPSSDRAAKTMHVDRRQFALGLAGLAAATSTALAEQTATPAAAVPTPAKPREPQPFDAPLEFHRATVTPRLAPFALDEVELGDGPLFKLRRWNRDYMLRLDADRLLHNFRLAAGLASTAKPLGGWEEPKSEIRGHFVGHYLSACALMAASSGDAEVRRRGELLVAGLAECQKSFGVNGYLAAFPEEFFTRLDQGKEVWVPFYTVHKILAGLIDMHEYAGNAQALAVALGLAGWIDAWTATKTEAHLQEILRVEFGGMAESFYNLAAITGEDRWARVGDRFEKKSFLNPLAARQDLLQGLHMNTHIPQVIAAARRYEISGDPRFRHVAEFFWETVTTSRTYATAGSSNEEHWKAPAYQLSQEIDKGNTHQECCCSYNMLKLTRHLYAWAGTAGYMDYYERALFNHRLGTMEPETGHTMYYFSLAPGAWKTFSSEDASFWCCTGSGVEEYSKLNDTLYFHDAEGVYVNLFASSTLHWKKRGIQIEQTTRFPEEERTTLTVHTSPAQAWTLRLRIPVWAEGATVELNGRALETVAEPGGYLALHRAWKPGDRIVLQLPMRLRVEALPDDDHRVAFTYGPLVLAGQFARVGVQDEKQRYTMGPEMKGAPLAVPTLTARGKDLTEWIKPVAGSPLTFRMEGQSEPITLKPVCQSWDRYNVYWRVS